LSRYSFSPTGLLLKAGIVLQRASRLENAHEVPTPPVQAPTLLIAARDAGLSRLDFGGEM
jgi:hypothetical protein